MTLACDECWEDLANAIVLNAVEDWRKAKFKLQFPSLASKTALNISRECEEFFRSSWFYMLTELDGNTFIKTLKDGFGFD